MRKADWKWLILLLVGLAGIWLQPTKMSAATTPTGLSLKQLFAPGTFNKNSAQIIDGPKVGSETSQIIDLTRTGNQVGGVWSLPGNEFDLNQDNQVSFWINVGTQSKTSGEGVAFVLHNDPRGRAAVAENDDIETTGESLGVWGIDNDRREDDVKAIVKTAIKNSWALEFDSHLNESKKNGRGDSFDHKLKGIHIAADYPGEEAAYDQRENNHLIFSDKYRYEMRHLVRNDRLNFADGQWHHVKLDWQAQTSTMIYEFDDVDVNGKVGRDHFKQAMLIDRNKLNAPNGKLFWGVVGATSKYTQRQQVIFESIPNLVKAKTTLKITNMTKKEEIEAGSRVRGKDQITYSYVVKYQGGHQNWPDVIADLNVPTTIDWTSGSITYTNGQKQTLAPPTKQNVKVQLEQTLSQENQRAVITFKGRAKAVTTVTPIESMTSVLQTHKYKSAVTAPQYKVVPARDLVVEPNKLSYQQKKGQKLTLSGQVKDRLHHTALTPTGVTVSAQLDGETIGQTTLKSVAGAQGEFELTLETSKLAVGKYTMTLQAVDRDKQESTVVNVPLEVKGGELTFQSVGTSGTFAPVVLTGKTQAVIRQSDWQLKVRDERGSGSKWQLKATASEFVNEKNEALRGNVYYRHNNHDQKIGTEAVVVDEHESQDDEETHDVIDCWQQDGLVMKTNAGAVSGSYSGTIKWTLADAP